MGGGCNLCERGSVRRVHSCFAVPYVRTYARARAKYTHSFPPDAAALHFVVVIVRTEYPQCWIGTHSRVHTHFVVVIVRTEILNAIYWIGTHTRKRTCVHARTHNTRAHSLCGGDRALGNPHCCTPGPPVRVCVRLVVWVLACVPGCERGLRVGPLRISIPLLKTLQLSCSVFLFV